MRTFTLEELKHSPSRKDGIDECKEELARRTTYNFIKKLAKDLKLLPWTSETATIFKQHFFAVRSLKKNDRFLVSASCLFLACKVDESPRCLRDVAYVMYATRNGSKPEELEKLRANPDAVLKELMEQIIMAEEAILYALDFDMNVDHPYSIVAKALKRLDVNVLEGPGNVYFQQTVNMLNDSLATTLCLQHTAAKLAHSAMFEVCRQTAFSLPIPGSQSFLDYFSISQADLDDIIPQMIARSKAAVAQAPGGGTPVPPQALLPQARAGPPLPSFRPIILTSDGQPARPASSSRPRAADVEEGELPSTSAVPAAEGGRTPKPSLTAPAPASVVAAQQGGPAAAKLDGPATEAAAAGKSSAAGAAPDSDAEEGIHHAPGSGDQNNHNEPATADGQQVGECSRKRTRSPGAVEEGEIGFAQCTKSPRMATL